MADKIVVLRAGRIEQVGSPMRLYDDPDNRFVAGFIGSPAMNFVAGRVQGGQVVTGAFDATLPATSPALTDGRAVEIGLRPDALTLTADGPFRVELAENLGGTTFAHLRAPSGEKLIVQTGQRLDPAGGGSVGLIFDPAHAFYFDAQTGQRLR